MISYVIKIIHDVIEKQVVSSKSDNKYNFSKQ